MYENKFNKIVNPDDYGDYRVHISMPRVGYKITKEYLEL